MLTICNPTIKSHDSYELRVKYFQDGCNASRRKVDFLFTYEEWLTLWVMSGHLHERGRKRGQYVMARYGGKGPYAVGNVRIVTVTENAAELWENPEHRVKVVSALRGNTHTKGWKHTEESLAKLRAARARQVMSEATKRKISETRKRQMREGVAVPSNAGKTFKRRPHSLETIAKMRESHKALWAKRRASMTMCEDPDTGD